MRKWLVISIKKPLMTAVVIAVSAVILFGCKKSTSPELSFKQIYSNGLEHVYTIRNDRDSIKDFVSQFKGLLSKRKIEIDKPIGFKDWNGLLMGREAHTDIEIVPGKKKGI